MKALFKISLLLCFGLLFGVLLAEGAVRAYLSTRPRETSWSDRPAFYFAHEAAPTAQDFPHDPVKPPGTFRIAVVGDSFTFAPYMQFTDAFPQKLETLLNLNSTEKRAEVINYGVPAYSLSHEVAVVERAIQEQADLIILQVTLNDPEIKHHRPTAIQTHLGDRFGAFKPEGRAGWVFRNWKTAGLVAERLHNMSTHQAYRDYFIDLFENPRSWNKYLKALKQIEKLCHKADVPVVAFIFPLFGLPLDEHYPFWGIHEKVSNAYAELNIPHEDLQKIYAGIPLSRLQVIPNVDRHPNEIAHRMAAEEIYLWLAERDYLPKELLIRTRYKTRLGITNQPSFNEQ